VSENPVRIRTARPYDAPALLDLKHRLDEETAFMMYEPGERDSSVRDLARDLAGVARSPNSVVLLAELGDQLAGYVDRDPACSVNVRVCPNRSRGELSSIPVDQDLLGGCGWGVLAGSFDEFAVDEGGSGTDQGDEMRRVDRAPAVLG